MKYLLLVIIMSTSSSAFAADDDYSFSTENKDKIVRALHSIEEIKDSLVTWQLAHGGTLEVRKLYIEATEINKSCVYSWKADLESSNNSLASIASKTRFYKRRNRKCSEEYIIK
jgi:hypothetical protein